jgi:coniferyl-aldehyde dehydrogenase
MDNRTIADEELLGRLNNPLMRQADASEALALRARYEALLTQQQGTPFPDWPTRAERLQNMIAMLLDHRERIKEAISADFGHRSRHETDLLEVFPSLEGLRHALRHGRGWMRERKVPVSLWFQPGAARILPQPLGVVGIIVPWNYPLFLLMGPLTSALVAGNRAMVKVSEFSPRFGVLMAQLLPQALGDEVVQVVQGGPEVAAAFSALPFGHLLFTGSTAVGRRVMAAASTNLVPVTLELGGKSPAIITAATCADDARFTHAVRRIMVGKVLNAGQTCIAPDYVLLPRAAMPRFITTARTILGQQYPDGAASLDYTGIASDRHFEQLQQRLLEATQSGANASPVMGPAGPGQRKFPLTVLTDCTLDSSVMQEEIFGPLLPLVPCETVDDAVAWINQRPHPLALYLFDDCAATQTLVLQSTTAGGVCLNETLVHLAQDNLPFGGVGASGMGHYHGQFGFEAMSKLKPVFRQSRINALGLLAPPYGALVARVLKVMLRR